MSADHKLCSILNSCSLLITPRNNDKLVLQIVPRSSLGVQEILDMIVCVAIVKVQFFAWFDISPGEYANAVVPVHNDYLNIQPFSISAFIAS